MIMVNADGTTNFNGGRQSGCSAAHVLGNEHIQFNFLKGGMRVRIICIGLLVLKSGPYFGLLRPTCQIIFAKPNLFAGNSCHTVL